MVSYVFSLLQLRVRRFVKTLPPLFGPFYHRNEVAKNIHSFIHSFIHSYITSIYIAPLQVQWRRQK